MTARLAAMTARLPLDRLWLPALISAASVGIGVLAGTDPTLAIVAAAGLGFVLLTLADLFTGLVMFTVLTFAAQVPTLAGPGLTFAKIAGLLLAISWIAALATRRGGAKSDFLSAHPGLTYALVLFLSWAALSEVWAESSSTTRSATGRLALNAILFLIIFTAVRTRKQAIWLVAAFVFGACIDAVYGMIFRSPDTVYNTARLGSAINRPGELAAALVAGLVLSLGLATALKRVPLARLATYGAVILCSIGIFLTGSRGGLIALAVALAAFIVVGQRWRGRLLVLAAVVAIAAFGFFEYAASSSVRSNVSSIGSGSGRIDLWTVGWRMIQAHPITGVGIGNFPVSSVHYVFQPGLIQQGQYVVGSPKVAHNTFLELWAESGIVGLLLFLVVVGFCMQAALRAARAFAARGDIPMEMISRALFVALAGFMAGAFFTSREYAKDIWLLLGLAPAMLAVARSEAAAKPGD